MAGRTTEQDRPLHILTVNINGLTTNGNRLLEELINIKSKNGEVDVVLLTKTKIGENESWENEGWEIFPTRYDSRSKGAAILLNKNRDFVLSSTFPSESYVIVNCCISGRSYTFVSVYHHKKDTRLLSKLSEKIRPLKTDMLVVGGDFNVALEDIDRTDGDGHEYSYRIRRELKSFMQECNLIDAWRYIHPQDREYTYDYLYNGNLCHSRLDYFFINADKRGLVQDCIINNDMIANHRPVSLFLHLKTPSTVQDEDVDKTLELDKLKIDK